MTPTEQRVNVCVRLDPDENEFLRAFAYYHNVSKSAALRKIVAAAKARTPKSKGGDK